MYKIMSDNDTIWSPGTTQKDLTDPKLKLATNTVGSLSFKMYPTHANYDSIIKMQSLIKVYQNDKIVFKGRVFSDKADFRKVKNIEVEGILGFFNDSIVRPYSYNGSVRGYLEMLITQHNNQEPAYKRFKLGNVTVLDPNDYIVRESSDFPKTWDEINNKLIKLLGGYIVIRYEEDANYIDYLADFTDVASQTIRYSVNLLDLSNEVKADNLATCIIPLGATIQNEDGTITRVDITSVNNGLDYIYSPIAEALYGRISRVVTWEDVTEPSNLLSKARAYLETAILLEGTLTIKAVDLHLTDKDIEAFMIGYYVGVYSEPHNINETMLLNSLDIPLADPTGFTFSLGRTKSSFTDTQFKNNVSNQIEVVKADIQKITSDMDKIQGSVEETVGSNQGSDNSGKYLGIDQNGNVIPVDPPEPFNIHKLTAKASIAENDEFPAYGANVGGDRKILWTTIKSTLKTFFDSLYATLDHNHDSTYSKLDHTHGDTYAKSDHKHIVADITDFPEIPEGENISYSDTEETIGSWIGGEILYRRTIVIQEITNTQGDYIYAHDIADIKLITDIRGILASASETIRINKLSATISDIGYSVDNDLADTYTGYITIEYTKN